MQTITIEVDLTKIRKNAKYFAERARLCAVVKANAYGHGAVRIAQTIEDLVSLFAVSTIDEGIELRLSGIVSDILVFTPPVSRYDVERATSYNLILTVCDEARRDLCKNVRFHVALNTGMNRYGFDKVEPFEAEGVYSHFTDALPFQEQFELFERKARLFPSSKKHIAATKGFYADKRYHLDFVRIGLGLYGYGRGVEPALKVYATAVQTRAYRFGGFGYFPPRKAKDVSTLRAGYADGLRREGRYCMDAIVAEGKYEVGQKVLILSNAEEEAKRQGTIPYEVLASLGRRAEYVYKI